MGGGGSRGVKRIDVVQVNIIDQVEEEEKKEELNLRINREINKRDRCTGRGERGKRN